MKQLSFFLIFVLWTFPALAQNKAIGTWATHFSYNIARSVAFDGKDKIYCADQNLFSYSALDKEFNTYSKVNGLSDVGIRLIRYNTTDNYLVMVYDNGNIDLLIDDNFINIPDIKNLAVSGSKSINDIFFFNKLVYLSTDFGISVLDPVRKEIKETYVLQNGALLAKINALRVFQNKFVAATDQGVFSADINSPVLQDFNYWQRIDTRPMNHLAVVNAQRIFLVDESNLYSTSNLSDPFSVVYTSPEKIIRVVEGVEKIYFSENGATRSAVMTLDGAGQIRDTFFAIYALDMVEVGIQFYTADGYRGLQSIPNSSDRISIHPTGPYNNSTFNVNIVEDKILVSGGGHSGWNYNYSSAGFYTYDYNEWKAYNRFENVPAMDSIYDILNVSIDPISKNLIAASYGGGLLEVSSDASIVKVYDNNGFITPAIGDPGSNRVYDIIYDQDNNLWMTNYAAPKQLVVRKRNGSWQSFALPFPAGADKNASQLVIDNANQKWVVAPRGIGLFVYNDNNTIDNIADDKSKLLTTGLGRGNLPNSFVTCVAKDQNGIIWVGTNDGIGIFNCPESVFSTTGCDGELKIVKYDENAGLLFQSEMVNTIAVDGANNKWVGTDNGIWKISDDAETILERFTIDNSPLPSNEINSIKVHPNTGDVFIATTKGLVSYRSTATEGKETNAEILVFPNPVPSSYEGFIAIKGLTENADVRITDVSGQLIYRTKAQGGQAVWNGKNYTGSKPMTGIYYVFVTNSDGTQTATTKFMFSE